MHSSVGKIIGAAIALSLVCMVIIGSFLGALHQPSPHRIPVGLVGPAQVTQPLSSRLDQQSAGAFTVTSYATEPAAHDAIMNRDIDGALVLAPAGGQSQLLVAGASGKFITEAVTTVFQGVAAANGQRLTVQDVNPLPMHDENGISPLFFVVGIVLPSIAFGIASSLVGRRLGALARLGAVVGFAVLLALVAVLTVDAIVGALTGSAAALIGVAAFGSFAVSATCAALSRLAGPPLAIVAGLLFLPVGLSAAGGPLGSNFVPNWYADLGAALPTGATMSAVRGVVYFNGNGMGSSLLVLSIWAAAAALLVLVPRPSREDAAPLPRERAIPTPVG